MDSKGNKLASAVLTGWFNGIPENNTHRYPFGGQKDRGTHCSVGNLRFSLQGINLYQNNAAIILDPSLAG